MEDFISPEYQTLLKAHQLDSFESLWNLKLEAVDIPNTERGGWSSVCRLELELGDKTLAFYLKRQCNHQSLSWQRPLGEPTFSRELRNISAYAEAGIAALDAVFFAERRSSDGPQAILLTAALDDYQALSEVLPHWKGYSVDQRARWCSSIGVAIARLHNARLTHHCLYPKHVYLRLQDIECSDPVRFIDLEKTRYQLLKWRDRVADVEALLRRCNAWSDTEQQSFLESYLTHLKPSKPLAQFQSLMGRRRANKAARS
ncbi:MAG: lipopolysaccharide kinase InaA family protein [Cellvibrionaceae bacterium]